MISFFSWTHLCCLVYKVFCLSGWRCSRTGRTLRQLSPRADQEIELGGTRSASSWDPYWSYLEKSESSIQRRITILNYWTIMKGSRRFGNRWEEVRKESHSIGKILVILSYVWPEKDNFSDLSGLGKDQWRHHNNLLQKQTKQTLFFLKLKSAGGAPKKIHLNTQWDAGFHSNQGHLFYQLTLVFRQVIGQSRCSWLVGRKTCSHTGSMWSLIKVAPWKEILPKAFGAGLIPSQESSPLLSASSKQTWSEKFGLSCGAQ